MIRFLALVSILAIAVPARASGNSDSGNSSQGSSNGSGGSSGQSGGSSQDSADASGASGEASGSSGDSTKQSQNSSNQSSGGTGDTLVVSAVGTAIVLVGAASTAGTVFLVVVSTRRTQQAELQLQRFLRERHAQVALAVMDGEGELFDAWAAALSLNPEERSRLSHELDASPEQTAMLRALDGLESVEDVRAFSAAFVSTLERVVGHARVQSLAQAAAQAG